MTTALLLIDIQNDYFPQGSMPLSNPESAALNARLLLNKFRSEKLPVIHVQHLAARPTATFFLPDTFGAEIYDTVKPVADETVICKHYPNSFRETGLEAHLQGLGVTHLVICGMMTHMCIDATTWAAKDAGYECTLIADACATKDLEIHGVVVQANDVHNGFLAALNYYYATVISTQEYLTRH